MDGAAAEAQALLGREALAALVEESRFGEIHERASTVVLGTGLCTPKLRAVVTEIPADRHADFGRALWELLHGDAPSRERFVGMVGALKANGEASWLMATLFPGLVAPHEHVVVDPHPFARNARRMEPQLVVSVTPNPIVYERLLDLSRRLEGELADHGLVARDLLDIHAFIVESTNPKNAKLLDVATKH
jgi:hypothetical protein